MLKYAFFWVCGDCDEPVRTFDMVTYVGHNFGVDGHMFQSSRAAGQAWGWFEKEFLKDGPAKDIWINDKSPFPTHSDELDYLKKNIKLFPVKFDTGVSVGW